jgi:hypothetical protein
LSNLKKFLKLACTAFLHAGKISGHGRTKEGIEAGKGAKPG